MGELKHNAHNEVREASPVEVQWAVGGQEDDLWWEGIVEQVRFLSLEWKREEVMGGVMFVSDDE